MMPLRTWPRSPRRRILVSAALAAVVIATTSPASVATAAPRPDTTTDVYTRDQLGDTGIQPNPSTASMFESPDIRSCNTAVMCAADQTPVAGGTSYVFVTLHNPGPYGSGVATGTLDVYYTTFGAGAHWPVDWVQFGTVNVTVYPGATMVTVPWAHVPSAVHFCLLTRWISDTDPMVFEGPNSEANTVANNNISWHNIDTQAVPPGGLTLPQPFALANVTTSYSVNDLVFTEPGAKFESVGGTVVVDLGSLFAGWQQAGGKGAYIHPIGGTRIQLTNLGAARISGVTIQPNTRPQIFLTFGATIASSTTYPFVVDEQGPATVGAPQSDLGGGEYNLSVG
jgi:hypothetical protein